MQGITRVMTNIARGFKDVNNVYTQHEPPMKNILEKITSSSSIIPKNRSTDQFPFVSEFAPPHGVCLRAFEYAHARARVWVSGPF